MLTAKAGIPWCWAESTRHGGCGHTGQSYSSEDLLVKKGYRRRARTTKEEGDKNCLVG